LADILSLDAQRRLPEPFQSGIRRHREIDSFTDHHPVFRQSIARLDARYRRYGGVIVDIFYDHLLTVQWGTYVHPPLSEFVNAFHRDVESCRDAIPTDIYPIFARMRSDGWLTSYGDIDGVALTLRRISSRLKRPFDLGSAISELDRHYVLLAEDFATFFPEIQDRFARTIEARSESECERVHPSA
jgi:acyl carrier protein phosphodiesterase